MVMINIIYTYGGRSFSIVDACRVTRYLKAETMWSGGWVLLEDLTKKDLLKRD